MDWIAPYSAKYGKMPDNPTFLRNFVTNAGGTLNFKEAQELVEKAKAQTAALSTEDKENVHTLQGSQEFVKAPPSRKAKERIKPAALEATDQENLVEEHAKQHDGPPLPADSHDGCALLHAALNFVRETRRSPRTPESMYNSSTECDGSTTQNISAVSISAVYSAVYVSRVSPCGYQYAVDGRGNKMEVAPEYWGMRISEIVEFWNWCKGQRAWRSDMSVRHLVEEIIVPRYTEGQSVALAKKTVPTRIRWLVSHCWDEGVEDFFQDLVSMLKHVCKEDDGIFVCFLCVFQGSNDEVRMQVTQNSERAEDGCFARVLKSVKHTSGTLCVIPNENLVRAGQGLYSRLWCGWEAYQASEQGIRVWIHPKRSSPQHLFGRGELCNYTLQHGSCGNPSAKSELDGLTEAQIRSAIESGLGWSSVDAKIKIALLNSWEYGSANVLPFMQDKDDRVFEAALLAFEKLGEAAAMHAERLADYFPRSPFRIAQTLMGMQSAGVAEVAKRLFHADPRVQDAAADALQRYLERRKRSLFKGPISIAPVKQLDAKLLGGISTC
mmetsp:Transcript_121618/g.224139  ORF Transcript_121618/g.224139 Transcript_121618/m.224139 type:complete len:552 (+) Transcript_121618:109-1764(+)